LAAELQQARTSLGPPSTQPAGDPAPTEPTAPVEDPFPEPEHRDLLATIEKAGPDGATPPEIPSSQPGDKLTEKIRGTESLTELEAMQRDLSRR
jgi:hypothetical protein